MLLQMHTGRRKEQWIGKNGISGERIKEAIGEIERYRKDMIQNTAPVMRRILRRVAALLRNCQSGMDILKGRSKIQGK